ncbi:cyanase [Leucothrix arctica]|uniref:Cyanate hydratase n=1 Tax=Leucothrix arctica TaxID=1481894 RepID=A0A317CH49_9GAMM|nr:cyanase [Leucothrix arctica]PWQ97461.1 cyanase [Leucothrix arctica]
MNKLEMTEVIMATKAAKNTTWGEISNIVGMSEVFITSCCLGMNSAPEAAADKLCAFLGLGPDVSVALQAIPRKDFSTEAPTDPLIYRFHEITGVYGDTLKELIHEKFGDGIMSAIDFELSVDKEKNPKGDRVVVTMNGKFLAYNQW